MVLQGKTPAALNSGIQMQRAAWAGPTSMGSGSAWVHALITKGQRVWKVQPLGTRLAVGISPTTAVWAGFSRASSLDTTGTAESSIRG